MKYIDSEKLIAGIKHLQGKFPVATYDALKYLITSLQQEQPKSSNNLVDVDAVREDFITEVYRVLDADPTNDRANAIIDAFDSLPTVPQQPEVDLEIFISDFFDKKDAENNGRWSEDDIVEAITKAYELGKAGKEESK